MIELSHQKMRNEQIMNTKDAYIEHLENTIKDLQKQVNTLTEMGMLLRKEKFGSSSERRTVL